MAYFEERCFKEVLEGCLEVNKYIINKTKQDKKTKKLIKKLIQKIDAEEMDMDDIREYIEEIK